MIKPKEIQQKARDAGVRDQQIEKDYILSWILKGVAEHEHLGRSFGRKNTFGDAADLRHLIFAGTAPNGN